jgi:hypothetical protein
VRDAERMVRLVARILIVVFAAIGLATASIGQVIEFRSLSEQKDASNPANVRMTVIGERRDRFPVVVSRSADASIPVGHLRAVIALEEPAKGGSSALFSVFIVVDEDGYESIEAIRRGRSGNAVVSGGDIPPTIAPVGGPRWIESIGAYEDLGPIRKLFANASPVHVVTTPPNGCDRSALPEYSPSAVWVEGPVANGIREGVWLLTDIAGEIVRLDVFRKGCFVESIAPWYPPNLRRLIEGVQRVNEEQRIKLPSE